jgi:hypothetical protein
MQTRARYFTRKMQKSRTLIKNIHTQCAVTTIQKYRYPMIEST